MAKITKITVRLRSAAPLPAPRYETKIKPVIEKILKDNGKEDLLTSGKIEARPLKNFGGLGHDETIIVFRVVGKIAYEFFHKIILPRLEKYFGGKKTQETTATVNTKPAPKPKQTEEEKKKAKPKRETKRKTPGRGKS